VHRGNTCDKLVVLLLLAAGAAWAGEPALPAGLGDDDEIELAKEEKGFTLPFDLSGFCELRAGYRLQEDPYQKEASLLETRVQAEVEKALERLTLRVTADFVYDDVVDSGSGHEIRLEEGRGWMDLREANVSGRPLEYLDIKVGRQILTWGTGDMIFINDLFPKDWRSFFIGRDNEYLKAPSDAVKLSVFTRYVNVDLVYTPRFDSDRFITGERISYWNSALGRRAGRDAEADTDRPEWLEDDEIALRAYRTIGAYEAAVYLYNGYWKSPAGMDPATGKATFPELAVYGASVVGPLLGGIARAEAGYYDSLDDRSGDDPLVRNGEFRLLLGYTREVGRELTLGVQYYLEFMQEHLHYENALPAGMEGTDEDRHVITVRLTKLAVRQALRLSLFGFYSPSDGDAYLRPRVHFAASDAWSVFGGADIFAGVNDHTFFGQFEKNSNVHAGARYSF
jgi:hypothetical protein